MGRLKSKKPNDIPYLIDFANNIGLNQHQLAIEMGMPNKSLSAWATGKYRPVRYKETRMKIIGLIATKIYSDVKEWEEYIDSCEE